MSTFHPRPAENLHAASCVKSYGVSPWNPPPPQYRAKGHLLYLSVTTLEGESVQLTCTVRGWFVSRSTSVVFDPTPRPSPKDFAAHSLLDLLHGLSPIFSSSFSKLVGKAQDASAEGARPRELLAITPIQQALAANPWLVEPAVTTTADPVRQQVSFLLSGATGPDGMEGAKDWNDEIQQAREMARETMQDRVNREKNLARVQAEFTAACVKGVISIARGDVIPLNPHEVAPAHMWLHRNIFFTKGLDSIDSFSHLGADEAAHVACGKDVAGIRALNQIDVNGACLLGHTVVDWAGERWVCQSFLPGIFRRKDEEIASDGDAKVEELTEGVEQKVAEAIEGSSDDKAAAAATAESSAPHLIVYGSDFEAGPEVVRWDASFHTLMEKVADGFRLAAHDVKAGPDGSKVSLWTSSEVKGLHGTDGRKYILDAYRLSPVDVEFLQKDLEGPLYTKANVETLTRAAGEDKADATEETSKDAEAAEESTGGAYPHRLLLLRPELLDAFWDSEFRKWATDLASKRKSKDTPKIDESAADKPDDKTDETATEDKEKTVPEEEQEQVVVQANGDIHVHKPSGEVTVTKAEGPSARFDLRFNPDAFVDTKPLPSGEKAKDVEQEKAHAFDVSLTTDESDPTVKAVRDASVFLRTIAIPSFLVDVITGRENCSDGTMLTQSLHKKGINMRYLGIVTANMERILTAGQSTDSSAHLNAFLVVSLQEMVFRAAKRILRSLIRGLLPDEWSAVVSHFLNCLVGVESDPKPVYEPSPFVLDSPSTWTSLTPTSLRAIITTEVQKRFRYNLPEAYLTRDLKKPQIVRELALRVGFQLVARDYQFEAVSAEAESAGKKAGKKTRYGTSTFEPVDIVAFVPTVKDAEPSSAASEETMEAGKITVNRGDKLAGLELMQESISLYETIHALFHKDVARAYNAYSVTVIQLYRAALGERSSEEPPKEGEVPEFHEQLQLAIRFQRQCVIVAERTLGLDHPDTLSYYQNLAMLEHLGEDLEMALKMFRHVLELWDVVYGVDHPDQLVLLTNIGQLLSLGSQFESSSKVFRSVCEVGTKIYGPSSVHIAQAQHALGQARFCVGDYAGAAEHSGIASKIFLDRLGKEDPLAIEAEGLHNAFVAQEKAAARGTAGKRFVPPQRAALAGRAANGTAPIEQQQQEQVITNGGAASAKKGAEAVKVDTNGVASRGHLEVSLAVVPSPSSKIPSLTLLSSHLPYPG